MTRHTTRIAATVSTGCRVTLAATSGVTTKSMIVIEVLAARRDGASINAAAKVSGINYRTAQRIVEAAAAYRQRQLAAVG